MKRKISDLMEHITPEVPEMAPDAPLDAQRIREMTMEKIETKKRPLRRWGMRLLTAAVLTVLLTITVFAAEDIMTYDNWFTDYFSGKEVVADISENQLALLESSITPINQSVTSDGYTVTLETAITDGYVAYFTFRVDAPEGVALDKRRYSFKEFPMDIFGTDLDDGKIIALSAGWQTLEDDDPTDNSIYMLLELGINNPEGVTASLTDKAEKTITLNTFQGLVEPEGIFEIQAIGEWRFNFVLTDTDLVTQEVEMLTSPVRCTAQRQAGQNSFDIAVQITSCRLRALTATLTIQEPLTGFWEGVDLDPIYIVMKDGSKVRARFADGTIQGDVAVYNLKFDVPISFADVDHIEFAGGDKAYMP